MHFANSLPIALSLLALSVVEWVEGVPAGGSQVSQFAGLVSFAG